MEALGILGFIFSLAALGKIVLLEKQLKESGILKKAAKSQGDGLVVYPRNGTNDR